jgi:uncharacterized protein
VYDPVCPKAKNVMRTSEADILIIPDLGDCGPDHWQSRWEARLPTAWRVEPPNWDKLDIAARSQRLREEADKATRPLVLVAHGFGGYVIAAAAEALGDKVRGAFIVTPPSPRAVGAMVGASFADLLLRNPLPFKTLVIASRNDDRCTYDDVEDLAKAWGAELSDAGNSGSINAESGHGPWPEGLMRFAGFMKGL